jgi:regulator of protease activity HflC (stomatin/prohibitin superfamily)
VKGNARLVPLFGFAVLSAIGCYQKIEPSNVGILFNGRSGISEQILKPQLTYVGPLQRLIQYPTSIHNASYVRAQGEGSRRGDDSIQASTIEGSVLPTDVTVAWHVDPANVVLAFKNFGTENLAQIQEDFIRYYAIWGVNVVSGKQSIFDLMSKERQKFGPDVKALLAPKLLIWGITVDDVYIGEVAPDKQIMDVNNERVARKNDLEMAKVSLQKAMKDARTTITNAERDAKLNQLKAQMGDKAVALREREIRRKAIDKWDGQPPMVGDGVVPFTKIRLY